MFEWFKKEIPKETLTKKELASYVPITKKSEDGFIIKEDPLHKNAKDQQDMGFSEKKEIMQLKQELEKEKEQFEKLKNGHIKSQQLLDENEKAGRDISMLRDASESMKKEIQKTSEKIRELEDILSLLEEEYRNSN